MPQMPESAVEQWQALTCQVGMVLLDGFHSIKHALRFGAAVPMIITLNLTESLKLADEVAPDVRAELTARAIEVHRDQYVLMAGKPHPTGMAALAVNPSIAGVVAFPDLRQAPIVVLDRPRHLGNVGAVVRVAAGMGAFGVLTTGEVDPWHPSVLRGAAGLHFATRVSRVELDGLPNGPVFAFDAGGVSLTKLTIPDTSLLIFGSERRGISTQSRALATQIVSIPMMPKVSSYNLATSVAIVLYHWKLQSETAAI
jgi:RNA methyltransferase, TrmH family